MSTIAIIAFLVFWLGGDLILDWIEHRKIEREKAKFQYVRRKRPARRRMAVA